MAGMGNIDWRGITPGMGGGAAVIPNGVYEASIVSSEWKDNAAGKGQRLVFGFEIAKGEYKGTVINHALNVKHTSEKAAVIARKEFALLCQCLKKDWTKVQDTQELHRVPLLVTVAVEEWDREDGTKGRASHVTRFAPLDRGGAPAPAPANENEGEGDEEDPF